MAISVDNLHHDLLPHDANRGFRTMNYADLKRVVEIEQAAYSHPWTIGIFRDCIRAGYNCWVLEHDREIIAYGIIMLAPGEAHILNICVDPAQQNRGIGRLMLQHLIACCAKTDIDMLILEVRRSNEPAKHLYQSENFHELGVRKGYYPMKDGREDAIIYARYISPDSH